MFAWIRSIYLPIAFHADENHRPLSTWVQINFALNRTVNIWNGRLVNNTQHFRLSSTYGLPVTSNRTLGIDVHRLMHLLYLPRQLRRNNAYGLRFLKVVDRTMVTTVQLSTNYSSDYDISWPTVARANFGLDLQWKPVPKQSNWFWERFGRIATHLVGLTPVIGPFLAIGFPIAWAFIADPDNAYNIFKKTFLLIDLTDRMVRELWHSAVETRKYLPDEWKELTFPRVSQSHRLIESKPKSLEEIGRNAAFIIAEETLAKSFINVWRNDLSDKQNELDKNVPLLLTKELVRIISKSDSFAEKDDPYIEETAFSVETDGPSDKNKFFIMTSLAPIVF